MYYIVDKNILNFKFEFKLEYIFIYDDTTFFLFCPIKSLIYVHELDQEKFKVSAICILISILLLVN